MSSIIHIISMGLLLKKYQEEIIPALKKELGLKNLYQIPRVQKISLNIGIGRSLKDPQFLEIAEHTLTRISGQKPIRTKAKKSIASFKIRQGMVVGLSVTLRKKRMHDFLEKLISFTLPRIRDFRGIDAKAVDQQGNLTIGFKEHIAFPEIRSDEIDKIHGIEVTIVTNAKSRENGLVLFRKLGFPFKK